MVSLTSVQCDTEKANIFAECKFFSESCFSTTRCKLADVSMQLTTEKIVEYVTSLVSDDVTSRDTDGSRCYDVSHADGMDECTRHRQRLHAERKQRKSLPRPHTTLCSIIGI